MAPVSLIAVATAVVAGNDPAGRRAARPA